MGKRRFPIASVLFLVSFGSALLLLSVNSANLYGRLYSFIHESVAGEHRSSLDYTVRELEQGLEGARKATRMLAKNKEFIRYFSGDADILKTQSLMKNMFYQYTNMVRSVEGLAVFTRRGETYFTQKSINSSFAAIAGSEAYGLIVSSEEPTLFYPGQGGEKAMLDVCLGLADSSLYFAYPVCGDDGIAGLIFVILSDGYFKRSLTPYMVLRSNMGGTSLFPEEQALLEGSGGEDLEKSPDAYYSKSFFEDRFTLTSVIPSQKLSSRLNPVILWSAVLFAATVAGCLILSRMLAYRLTRPLSTLSRQAGLYSPQKGERGFEAEKKGKRQLTFRETLMYQFILTSFLPLIVFDVFFFPFAHYTAKEFFVEREQLSYNRAYESAGRFFTLQRDTLKTIAYDLRIQGAMKEAGAGGSASYYSLIRDLQILHSNDSPVFLYDSGLKLHLSSESLSGGELTEDELGRFVSSRMSYRETPAVENAFGKKAFRFFLRITDIYSGDFLGVACSESPEAGLLDIYREQGSERLKFYLVDGDGSVLSKSPEAPLSDEALLGLLNGQGEAAAVSSDTALMRRRLPDSGREFIGVYSLAGVSDFVSPLVSEQLMVLALIFLLVIFAAYFLSVMLTDPIRRFYALTERIGGADNGIEGALPLFPEEFRVMEFSQLGRALNGMTERIELLLDEVVLFSRQQSELETRRKEAEILALQSQINPHFLYNTFESINSMLAGGQNDRGARMIRILSELLRYSADREKLLVTLEDELDYLMKYLEIMNQRFQNRVSFRSEAPAGHLRLAMVKLTLQPIVENSITHGLLPKGGGGSITLRTRMEDGFLVIELSDDGVGIERAELDRINILLSGDEDYKKIGIYNVNTRIKMVFGKRCGLFLNSVPGEGTTVLCRIKAIE